MERLGNMETGGPRIADTELERRVAWGRAANLQWQREQAENRRARRHIAVWLACVAALLLVWLVIGIKPASAVEGVRVIDGDTLVIGTMHHRIHNIDAPELDQTCSDAAGALYACGQQARLFMVKLVLDATGFTCTTLGTDKYRRALSACVWLNQQGERYDVGETMLRAGWALRFRPHSERWAGDRDAYGPEAEARKAKVGLWQGSFISPYEWRQRHKKPVPYMRGDK